MHKRKLSFDQLTLGLSIVLIIAVSLFQWSHYVRDGRLPVVKEYKMQRITDIMYFNKSSIDTDIKQIIKASDEDFSYKKSKTKWIKFRINRDYDKDENVLFIDQVMLEIDDAYLYINGKVKKVDSKDNFIDSYVSLPGNFDTDKYVYIKLKNSNITNNFDIKLSNEENFYRYQYHKFIFRALNIAILAIIVVLYVLLYLFSKGKKYFYHAIFLKEYKSDKIKMQNLELEATTDTLTKLSNRSYFEKSVLPQISDADQNRGNTSLLILDIDHFKHVNDTYGHNIGDILLVELAAVIRSTVRRLDEVIRWGGEEFVVVFLNTNINDAFIIAEKIRRNIEEHMFSYVGKITVSIGVAEKHMNEKVESWIEKADKALYKAKNSGRNKVEVCYLNMSPIKVSWSEVMECNNPEINKEHKALVYMMNDLIDEYFNNYQEKTFLALYPSNRGRHSKPLCE